MSTFKKLLALTLALAMVLSVTAFAGYSKDTYKDAADIDADCESAIELMYALDIMTGDNLGNFNPKATITRGEMAKMIYVILNYGDDDLAVNYKGAKFFSDVNAGDWYEGYVNYMAMTKLVQGRPDGTFGPNDPVTTAEAAKMLLTALGYSAADRGYTGANWAQNVLSDAAILGLLKGYNYSTTGYAPRQWVAVMVENALGCYTIDTMRPTFGGLLISGVANSTKTMGQKYYGYVEYTGYLVAANGYKIDNYTLDKDAYDEGDFVLDLGDVDVCLDGDVTVADLGQQFKVIAIDDEAISIRNTGKSVVAEDEIKDVTYELTYATDDNEEDNDYLFTVGEESAYAGSVNVMDVVYGNETFEPMTEGVLKTFISTTQRAGDRNDIVRAIDKDNDGDFDYVIYTPVEYAYVTKVATSQKYGDYVKAKDMNDEYVIFKQSSGSNLYIEDCIITEGELEVGNYAKFTWNMDEEKYNVEVLPVVEWAEFESRKINKGEYTFAGETYGAAANGHNTLDALLKDRASLGVDFDIVVDGDLLVYIEESDSTYSSMDEINENLAVLIEADYNNVDNKNTKQVLLLTIDGEQNWYTYDVEEAADEDEGTDDVVLTWAEVRGTEDSKGVVTCAEWDQLVIVNTNDDGEVYLEKLVDGEELALDPDNDLVDIVEIMLTGEQTDESETLDVDGTPTYGDYRVAGDNKFFAYIDDEYTVITVNELEEGEYEGVEAYALIADGTYYDSVVGGYLIIGDAAVSEEGFLWVTDLEGLEDEDGATISVMFTDETELDLYYDEIDYSDVTLAAERCYYYTFDGETYTLAAEWAGWDELYVEAGNELYVEAEDGYAELDPADYDFIAVKVIEKLREQADGQWEVQDVTLLWVTAEELAEILDECVALVAEDDLTYSFDYDWNEYDNDDVDDVLYVQITANMFENQYGETGDAE